MEFLQNDEKIVLTSILLTLTILGVITNVFVVYAITSFSRHKDIPSNLFILNQAFAHLGNVLSTICYVIHMFYWIWGVVYTIFTFTLFSSLGSLCLMTVNRLVSVVWPLRYPSKITAHRANVMVVLVWSVALTFTLLHLLGYAVYSDPNFFNYGRYYLMLLILVFIGSNFYMFYLSRKQSKHISNALRPVQTGLQQSIRDDLKCIKTVGMVGITFVMGWFPLIILFFLYGDKKEEKDFQRFSAFLLPLTIVNVISDPFIYYVRSSEFRKFYKAWKRKQGLGRLHSTVKIENAHSLEAFYVK